MRMLMTTGLCLAMLGLALHAQEPPTGKKDAPNNPNAKAAPKPEPKNAKAVEAAPAADGEDVFAMAQRLQKRVSIENDIPDTPLRDAIEFLSEKFQLNLQVDPRFPAEGGPAQFQIDRLRVELRAESPILDAKVHLRKMKSVRLETVLNHLLAQINATFLIQPDQLLIVSLATLAQENAANNGEPTPPALPLVTAKFSGKTVTKAAKELASRANVTIVCAVPAFQDEMFVEIELVNTPVDRAVALMAESVGVRSFRKGSTYLISHRERIAELERASQPVDAAAVPAGEMGPVFGIEFFRWLATQRQSQDAGKKIDELNQKLAELEKRLGEKK